MEKSGLAKKLSTTYFIIIISTIISGSYCLYVLNMNSRSNTEMRTINLPSIQNLKDMKQLMQEIKKLTETWVYVTNNKDKDRLQHILQNDYPQLDSNILQHKKKWHNDAELEFIDKINTNNIEIIDTINKITQLLNNSETYLNDETVNIASDLNEIIKKQINDNDKLYTKIIEIKNSNIEKEQNLIAASYNYVYISLFITLIIIILVSYFSMRYSKFFVVKPILILNEIISDMSLGNVVALNEIKRTDEIGEIHNAISKMIESLIQKINFSEQIGKGNYNANFNLLSEKDKFGKALLRMRDDLKRTNEALIEQDKRLIDAQKLARFGNYFYDIKNAVFHSSATLDEILGIDSNYLKTNLGWKSLILPEFKDTLAENGLQSIKNKERFTETYIVKRHNDGQERWVSVIGEFKVDENGMPITMFGTMQDITESKTLEIDLNNSYKIATDQNKRLLNFSYIVSHNLRMHAVNIHSLLSIYDEAEDDTEKKEVIELLHKASKLLDETMYHLNDVVAMQNPVSVDIIPIELCNSINHAIDILKTQIATKNAKIINNVNKDIIINYNPAYIDSIVLNFISNALKYSHPDRQPIVIIDFYKDKNYRDNTNWVLEIADNGIGIDMKKNSEKLFGMYKTFNGNKDAKGIGLFLTKYQVEALGGCIEVFSELNKGTTFKIHIK